MGEIRKFVTLPDHDAQCVATGERPSPRDRTGPVIPHERALPVSATTLARSIDGAAVPKPNIVSAAHLGRIKGGLLYAAVHERPRRDVDSLARLRPRAFGVAATRCSFPRDVSAVGRGVVREWFGPHAGQTHLIGMGGEHLREERVVPCGDESAILHAYLRALDTA